MGDIMKDIFPNFPVGEDVKVEKIEVREKGIFTYIKGEKKPFPGFLNPQLLFLCAIQKYIFLFYISHPYLLPFFKSFYLETYRKGLKYFEFSYPQFCSFVRSLIDAFVITFGLKFSDDIRDFYYSMFMILELDSAYRLRFQRVLYNKVIHDKKDLLAVFKELETREKFPHMKKKWKIIRILLNVFLPFLEWKFKVLTFFKNINNIDLSEEDKYWLNTIRGGFII
jgi:hypothetical protein